MKPKEILEPDDELTVAHLKGEPPRRYKKNLTRFYLDHIEEVDKYDEFYGT